MDPSACRSDFRMMTSYMTSDRGWWANSHSRLAWRRLGYGRCRRVFQLFLKPREKVLDVSAAETDAHRVRVYPSALHLDLRRGARISLAAAVGEPREEHVQFVHPKVSARRTRGERKCECLRINGSANASLCDADSNREHLCRRILKHLVGRTGNRTWTTQKHDRQGEDQKRNR